MKWFSNGVVSSFIILPLQLLGYHFLRHNEWMTPCFFWTLWGLECTALQEYPIQLHLIWLFLNQEVFMAIFWGTCSEYLMIVKHVIMGRVWLMEGPIPLTEAPLRSVVGWCSLKFVSSLLLPKGKENLHWSAFLSRVHLTDQNPFHPTGFFWRQNYTESQND